MDATDAVAPGSAMDAVPDLEVAAQRVGALLSGVGDEQLSGPTPCAEFRVRDLLVHLIGLTAAFRDAARKDLGPGTATAPQQLKEEAPPLPDDWRSALARQLDELVEAWRSPAAWEGTTQAGGVTLEGAMAGRIALNELVLHGWDLARATRQRYGYEEGDGGRDRDERGQATLRASLALLEQGQEEDGAARNGIFGPVVEVPPDAPLIDRAVGLSGRQPSWTAPDA